MSAINPRHLDGPITHPVSAVVAGGQLVAADQTVTTASTVTPAGAASLLVIGVALTDAAPAGTDAATDLAARPAYTTVAHDVVVPVSFASAAKFGDLLKAAAAGAVTKWVHGTDTDFNTVVGRCEDANVSNGTVAFARIF